MPRCLHTGCYLNFCFHCLLLFNISMFIRPGHPQVTVQQLFPLQTLPAYIHWYLFRQKCMCSWEGSVLLILFVYLTLNRNNFPWAFHLTGTWQHPQLLKAKLMCSWWHSLVFTTFTVSQFYSHSTCSYFLKTIVDSGNEEVECSKKAEIKMDFKIKMC